MKPESQIIAIAEACGWKVLEPEVKPAITYLWGLRESFILEEDKEIIPDYLNDLNAMHDAEQVLTSEQVTSYVYSLELMNERWATPAFATASQRAEAFLRTIGKWEESK